MVVYVCPKCGFRYPSPVRAVEVTHNCAKTRNHQERLKESVP